MNHVVTIPADAVALLTGFVVHEQPCHRPEHTDCTLAVPPARQFVVHTDKIEPATCPTCGGTGAVSAHCAPPVPIGLGRACSTCDGKGTVPAVVTLAVEWDVRRAGDSWYIKDADEWIEVDEVPAPRPVGTATVTDCWPIDRRGLPRSEYGKQFAHVLADGRVLLWDGATWTDRADRTVIQPGRWLLRLDNVEAT